MLHGLRTKPRRQDVRQAFGLRFRSQGPRPLIRSGVFLAVCLTLGARAPAEEAELSVLSSWEPGTYFHVGVTSTSMELDRCIIFIANDRIRGGDACGFGLQLDPRSAVQVVARPSPDQSTSMVPSVSRWSWGTSLPSVVPTDTLIHVQAVLTSSTSGRALYSGVVSGTLAAGTAYASPHPPEKLFSMYTFSNWIRVHEIDVDHAKVDLLLSLPVPGTQPGDFLYPSPPQVSSDRSKATISIGFSTPGYEILLLDLEAGTGTWLPPSADGGRYFGPARFRPGCNDELWVLKEHGSGGDRDYRFAAYNVLAGQELQLLDDVWVNQDTNPNARVIDRGWNFDAAGEHAYFIEYRSGQYDLVQMKWVPTGCGSVGDVQFANLLSTGKQSWLRPFLPVPHSTRVLGSAWEAGPGGGMRHFGSDIAGGVELTAFMMLSSNSRFDAVSADGGYAFVTDAAAGSTRTIIDTARSFIEGRPLPVLGQMIIPYVNFSGDTFIPVTGSLMVFQNAGSGSELHKIWRDASGFHIQAFPADFNGDRITLLEQPDFYPREGRGWHGVTHDGRGLLGHFKGGAPKGFGLIDVATMTLAWKVNLPSGHLSHFIF